MRSPNRIHEHSSFFKYLPFNTAKIVLDTCSLRWSSPVIFNDPFDVPREIMPGINEINISKALAKKLIAELVTPREDIQNLNPKILSMLMFFKKNFPFGIPEELIDKFKEIIDTPSIGPGAPESIKEMKDVWITMLNARRILCLTESATITSMWNHYADGYKGVVIELECIDAIDSPWLIAKPIKYTNEAPLTYSAEGMAELLLLPTEKAADYINNEITFIKTVDWSYEREWRVSSYSQPMNQEHFSDLKFHPLELKSVILGPLFDSKEYEQISLLVKRYPMAKIYNSSFSADRKISIKPMTV